MRNLMLLLLLGFTSQLKAEDMSRDLYFEGKEVEIGERIICEEKSSIGFDWKNGKYKQTRFTEDKYRFIKMEHRPDQSGNSCGPDDRGNDCRCQWLLRISQRHFDYEFDGELMMTNRCYFFEYNGSSKSILCKEFYDDGRVDKITCDTENITFHPEQLFLTTPSVASKNVDLFPKDDYKDSFVISHGTCRRLAY